MAEQITQFSPGPMKPMSEPRLGTVITEQLAALAQQTAGKGTTIVSGERLLTAKLAAGKTTRMLLWIEIVRMMLRGVALLSGIDYRGTEYQALFGYIPRHSWGVASVTVALLMFYGLASTKHNQWRIGLIFAGMLHTIWGVAMIFSYEDGGILVNGVDIPFFSIGSGLICFTTAALALDPRTLTRLVRVTKTSAQMTMTISDFMHDMAKDAASSEHRSVAD